MNRFFTFLLLLLTIVSCKKSSTVITPTNPTLPSTYFFTDLKVNGAFSGFTYNGLNQEPEIKISFSAPINAASIKDNINLSDSFGNTATFSSTFENNDNTLVIKPTALQALTKYILTVNTGLLSKLGNKLQSAVTVNLTTSANDVDKFARISDNDLLTLIQKQTFKYFWDFAHPNSGMARERNTSGDIVTTGGTGFGIMSIVTAVNRNFITRIEGKARIQKILSFLKSADRFHGVFPHWINGNTGKVQAFSAKDNGADLVETAFLMEGLLVARQYFNSNDADEVNLRADVNLLFNAVEWDWFRKNGEDRLYWHWSSNFNWEMNLPVRGWNEALMVYVLAASSTTHTIPKSVYDAGWAANGGMKNGNTYYGVQLPLGPPNGGPLFFEHYSFMALNPNSLTDAYANYEVQAKAHTKINYNYCVADPLKFGYSKDCWGLTASDINGGYTASSPNNDKGYIAPTAAVASLPFAPEESMQAIRFFYYKLGDKLLGEYGFKDAFSLHDPWFAQSYLAIDQGPQIVMIENYRTGLIWDLFMSCPEVKSGLIKLGFQSPKI
ncbi:glucoamylase family protein [Daejeonella sp.]|uniref:glucoamylase family protein n=1 Tax=Daejeonella sp. TaxID=2805397 RepID=UPI0025C1ECB9|nr:glucoamylase family protein [Daejeonella sp.]